MALSGIEIYKLLPKTNCKDCGFPTCMAFALKLAAKQVELSACPHVSEEAQAQLAASSEPPVRLITLKSNGNEFKVGNEVVLFRHEKTFYNKPGFFYRVLDSEDEAAIKARVKEIDSFSVNYVGIDLVVDGFAVNATSDDGAAFAKAIKAVRSESSKPLILISPNPDVLAAGLAALEGETPLIYGANPDNWEAMADLAAANKVSLGVKADTLEALADLTQKIKDKGVVDLVIAPGGRDFSTSLLQNTIARKMALAKNFRPFGFPILSFPCDTDDPDLEVPLAA